MIIPKRCIAVDCPAIDVGKLRVTIDKLRFRECSKEMEESWGFFQFDELGDSEELVHVVDRFTLLNLRRDKKTLNKTKLSRAWRKELVKQEKDAEMVFDKPKREEVREQVKKKLFKETDPDETYFKVVYDSIQERLYVLTSTPADCEYIIEKLNRALEGQEASASFKADTLVPQLTDTLTSWLYNPEKAEEHGFSVGEDMMLKGDNSFSATLKHQVADSPEVREHLGHNKQVQKVQLISTFDDGVEVPYVISNTTILSQIDLKGVCQPLCKVERENHSDVAALKDAEFMIWFSALSDLYDKVKTIPVE